MKLETTVTVPVVRGKSSKEGLKRKSEVSLVEG